jgi:hypothetical protein
MHRRGADQGRVGDAFRAAEVLHPRRSRPALVARSTGPTSVVGPGSQASPGARRAVRVGPRHEASCRSYGRKAMVISCGLRYFPVQPEFVLIRKFFPAAAQPVPRFSSAPRIFRAHFPASSAADSPFPNFRPVRICLRHAQTSQSDPPVTAPKRHARARSAHPECASFHPILAYFPTNW